MAAQTSSAALATTWATAAHAQRLGGGGGVDIPVGRIIAAFILCALLAVAVAVILKRRGKGGGIVSLRAVFASSLAQRRIEVIETRRASAHADICLVRCDDDEYLLLCSPQRNIVLRRGTASPKRGDPL